MLYLCPDERRRALVRAHPQLNGIDFVDVLPRDSNASQRRLRVHFLKQPAPACLTPDNVLIVDEGLGQGVNATGVSYADGVLVVQVGDVDDTRIYMLHLVQAGGSDTPLAGLDPRLAAVQVSFAGDDADETGATSATGAQATTTPGTAGSSTQINYLAKDYASFRQLLLDRLSLLVPQWQERSSADLGVALIDLLAYVGDYLSYRQDAIATEAYMSTARKRISVRRHARLTDYLMHDGQNARVWVQLQVDSPDVAVPKGSSLVTQFSNLPTVIRSTTDPLLALDVAAQGVATALQLTASVAYDQRGIPVTVGTAWDPLAYLADGGEVFETMHDIWLYPAHNQIAFYTWSDTQTWLPVGATQATLCDDPVQRLRLCVGDVLILMEQPSGQQDSVDANPAHRQAVRLSSVTPEAIVAPDGTRTYAPQFLTDPLTGQAIVEVEWFPEDQLTFSLTIGGASQPASQISAPGIAIALGNIVLADHGRTVTERLPPVSSYRYWPHLSISPLTWTVSTIGVDQLTHFALGFDPRAAASTVYDWRRENLQAAISLKDGDATWTPCPDLLHSGANDTHFVVESEADGTDYLRFGDDQYGKRPTPGQTLLATYRVGNGTRGNVGARALAHIVSTGSSTAAFEHICRVSNPLAAQGGIDPEGIEQTRQRGAGVFLIQERGGTTDDYAMMAEYHPQVDTATAVFRWTGSWRTVLLTVQPVKGVPFDDALKEDLQRFMAWFVLAGDDLVIDGPATPARLPPVQAMPRPRRVSRGVPADGRRTPESSGPAVVLANIEMEVVVYPSHFRGDVQAALTDVFSSRTRRDGQRGLFHPDNLTFGQTIYLSVLYAAAYSVPGVAEVQITRLGRSNEPGQAALREGKLKLHRREMPRLDNDPNLPQHGIVRMSLRGGK